jgi:hypothetical protein
LSAREAAREPSSMRTVCTFQSPLFDSATPRDHFINPGCYGDDAARWLSTALRARGLQADAEPGMEALHAVLAGVADIHTLAWHHRADFDAGREELGASTPNAA